jgi:hypothetical protein
MKGPIVAAAAMMLVLFGIRPLFWSALAVCLIHRARQIGSSPPGSPDRTRPLPIAAHGFAKLAVPIAVFACVFGCSTLFWTSITSGVVHGLSRGSCVPTHYPPQYPHHS